MSKAKHMRNKVVTSHNPKFKKAGWYVAYEPNRGRRVAEVFNTKAQAMRRAHFVEDWQNIAYVDWVSPDATSLRFQIGNNIGIIDYREERRMIPMDETAETINRGKQ